MPRNQTEAVLGRHPARNPTLEWADLGSEIVVVDRTRGELMRLDAVGAAIWRQLDGTRPLDTIVRDLRRRFVVDAAAARRDASGFLRRLKALGLVVQRRPTRGAPRKQAARRAAARRTRA